MNWKGCGSSQPVLQFSPSISGRTEEKPGNISQDIWPLNLERNHYTKTLMLSILL
jgi:hypothetical protein